MARRPSAWACAAWAATGQRRAAALGGLGLLPLEGAALVLHGEALARLARHAWAPASAACASASSATFHSARMPTTSATTNAAWMAAHSTGLLRAAPWLKAASGASRLTPMWWTTVNTIVAPSDRQSW